MASVAVGRVDEGTHSSSTNGTVRMTTAPRERYDSTFHMSTSTEQCPKGLLNSRMSVSAKCGGRALACS